MPILSESDLKALNLITHTQSYVRDYSDKKSQTLDIARMLKGEKRFWVNELCKEICTYKKLIVTDWQLGIDACNDTLQNNKHSKIIIEFLNMHPEFDVYFWIKDKLILIKNELEAKAYFPFLRDAVSAEEVYIEAANLGICRDDIEIIDPVKVNEITAKMAHFTTVQDWQLDVKNGPYTPIILLDTLTQKQAPALQKIIDSFKGKNCWLMLNLSDENINKQDQYLNDFIQIIQSQTFNKLVLNQDAAMFLYQNMAQYQQYLSSITELVLDKFHNHHQINHLLSHFKALNELTLIEKTRVSRYTKPFAQEMNELLSLTLHQKTSLNDLINLFNKAPNLKQISVALLPCHEDLMFATNACFPNIEVVLLLGEISKLHLMQLLLTLPNLKQLVLNDCHITDATPNQEFLERQQIHDKKSLAKHLRLLKNKLLKNTSTNLKHLEFSNCTRTRSINTCHFYFDLILAFKNTIESLIIYKTDLLSEAEEQPLPQYEEINLCGLPKLKKLHINAQIEPQWLFSLLKAAPELNDLEYEGSAEKIDEGCLDQYSNLQLHHLQSLRLIDILFSHEMYLIIKLCAPALKHLSIDNVGIRKKYQLNVDGSYPMHTLPNIETAHFIGMHFSSEHTEKNDYFTFEHLLNMVRHAKSIKIDDVTTNNLPTTHGLLTKLEADIVFNRLALLKISHSKLCHDAHILVELFTRSPQLKHLELIDCHVNSRKKSKESTQNYPVLILKLKQLESLSLTEIDDTLSQLFLSHAKILLDTSKHQLKTLILNQIKLTNVYPAQFKRLNCLHLIEMDALSNIAQFQLLSSFTQLNFALISNDTNTQAINTTFPNVLFQSYYTASAKGQNHTKPQNNYLHFDGQTEVCKNLSFHVDEIFLPKITAKRTAAQYRLHISTGPLVKDNNQISTVINTTNNFHKLFAHCAIDKKNTDLFKRYQEYYHQENNIFYGQLTIELSDEYWSLLPSLSSSDELKHIHIDDEFELAYFPELNLYGVKGIHHEKKISDVQFILQENLTNYAHVANMRINDFLIKSKFILEYLKTLSFNWTQDLRLSAQTSSGLSLDSYLSLSLDQHNSMASPCELNISDNYLQKIDAALPEWLDLSAQPSNKHLDSPLIDNRLLNHKESEIKPLLIYSIIDLCKNFNQGALSQKSTSGIDILNALLQENKGACRHRAQLCKALFDVFGIASRMIYNDCHAYIEVLIEEENNKQWLSVDLGGYAATLIEKPLPIKVPKPSSIPLISNKAIQPTTASTITNFMENNPFATWRLNRNITQTDTQHYVSALLNQVNTLPDAQQQILLICDSKSQIQNLNLTLFKKQTLLGKRYFYIHDLDDIALDKMNIKEDGSYDFSPSLLMLFLSHAQAGDLLLLNWSEYKACHIGLNTVVDSRNRQLSNVQIPVGVIVACAITHANMKQVREDFYSRFKLKEIVPQNLNLIHYDQIHPHKQNNDSTYAIHLYHEQDWETALIGQVYISDEKIRIKEGALRQAIRTNTKSITIINPPLNNSKFEHFMATLILNRYFDYFGEEIKISQDVDIFQTQLAMCFDKTYCLESLNDKNRQEWMFVLNTTTYKQFYENYQFTPKLQHLEGWINPSRHNTETVILVTESISAGKWAQLLTHAEQCGTRLRLIGKHGLFPQEMESKRQHSPLKQTCSQVVLSQTSNQYLNHQVSFIHSKDIDLSLSLIANHVDLILELNASTGWEIIESMTLKPQNATNFNALQYKVGVLWQSLSSGKKVALSLTQSSLNQALMLKLQTLFCQAPHLYVNGQRAAFSGQLIIVSEQVTAFNALSCRFSHEVSSQLIQAQLYLEFEKESVNRVFEACASIHRDLSYIQLRTVLRRLAQNQHQNPLLPFLINDKEFQSLATQLEKYFPPTSIQANTGPFEFQERAKIISDYLQNEPCVFLIGATGAGKSTLVLKELPQYLSRLNVAIPPQIYVGMDKINQWANASPQSITILFIDEANLLGQGTLEGFASLYAPKPFILHEGQSMPLSPNHKVIFAGNFTHYVGRLTHAFNTRFGNYLIIPNYSDALLKRHFIDPYLSKTALEQETIAKIILHVFHLVNLDNSDVALSPRNLKNISLRINQIDGKYSQLLTLEQITWLALYDEIRYLIPAKSKQTIKLALIKALPDYKNIKQRLNLDALNLSPLNDFAATHLNARRLISWQLALRQQLLNSKQEAISSMNGILLEGMPGLGKSVLAEKILIAAGLKLANQALTTQLATYYKLSGCDALSAKQTLLMAFHAGAIVIIDELNTLPFLEILLNQLMMGINLDGKPAQNPGFMVIATQNPISFSGRYALSPALENRFLKLCFKEFNQVDLEHIAKVMHVDPILSKRYIGQFFAAKHEALQKHLSPAPTARDVINFFFSHTQQSHSTLKRDKIEPPVKANNDDDAKQDTPAAKKQKQ